jgi:hypothetical protein
MSVKTCAPDDLIEMTPPSAPELARLESKRLALVLVLLAAISCLCVISVSKLSQLITAQDTIGAISFLPQIF